MIIVFTRGDDLKRDEQDIENYITEAEPELKEIIEKVGHRYLSFDNVSSSNETNSQVQNLLDMIDEMLSKNGGKYFSKDVYLAAEENVIQRTKELRKTEMREHAATKRRHLSPFVDCLHEERLDNEKIRREINFQRLKEEQLQLEIQSAKNWKESFEMARQHNSGS